MQSRFKETIFALSTIFGKSGVAVIRISGPMALSALEALGVDTSNIKHKRVFFKKIYNKNQELIDHAICLYFKSPESFTGEDIVELHTHGSIAVINDVLFELSKLDFLRPAEPGEFIKTAFINGKMDLTEVEAVSALIEAETSLQRKIAIEQVDGKLSKLLESWRILIIRIMSEIEAIIDFPTEDVPQSLMPQTKKRIEELSKEILSYLNRCSVGYSIMQGILISIFGLPNAGKSTLINHLASREVAIVSEIKGTTRDTIEIKMNVAGYSVIIADTAGINQHTQDPIEKEGIRRAYKSIEKSDIKLLVIDSTDNIKNVEKIIQNLKEENSIIFLNKIDLLNKNQLDYILNYIKSITTTLVIYGSLKNMESPDSIISELAALIKKNYQVSDEPLLIKLRYQRKLQECIMHLNSFDQSYPLEILAEIMRSAANSIGDITGKIHVEEILDEVFGNFCIGK